MRTHSDFSILSYIRAFAMPSTKRVRTCVCSWKQCNHLTSRLMTIVEKEDVWFGQTALPLNPSVASLKIWVYVLSLIHYFPSILDKLTDNLSSTQIWLSPHHFPRCMLASLPTYGIKTRTGILSATVARKISLLDSEKN